MYEPQKITAGFYYKWTETSSTYPASSGYTLKYVFFNASDNLPISSVTSGDDHVIEWLSAETSKLESGTHAWKSYAEKDGEKYPIAEGVIEVEANVLEESPVDFRSHARRTLEAIEANIERRATKEQMSLSIAGRSLQYMTLEELINARSVYYQMVQDEITKQKIDAGLKPGGRVLLQFE